ncbi:MAG: hypothetical protein ACRDCW_02465 [Sarcina sp.]
MRRTKGSELSSHPFPLKEEGVRLRGEYLSKQIEKEDRYRMAEARSSEYILSHTKSVKSPHSQSNTSLKDAMKAHSDILYRRRMAAYDRINGYLDIAIENLNTLSKELGVDNKKNGGVVVSNKQINLTLANEFLSDDAYRYIENEIIKEIDSREDIDISLRNLIDSVRDLSGAFDKSIDMTLKERSFGGFDSFSISIGRYDNKVFHNGKYKNTHTFEISSREFEKALMDNGCSARTVSNPSIRISCKSEFSIFIHSMVNIALDEIANNVCVSKDVLLSALRRKKYSNTNLGGYITVESLSNKKEKNEESNCFKFNKALFDTKWFSIIYVMGIVSCFATLVALLIKKIGG